MTMNSFLTHVDFNIRRVNENKLVLFLLKANYRFKCDNLQTAYNSFNNPKHMKVVKVDILKTF